MTNIETIKEYLEEVKPKEGNFSINYEWLMQTLDMAIDADKRNVLINPAYLRAEYLVVFDGKIPDDPPAFDTW